MLELGPVEDIIQTVPDVTRSLGPMVSDADHKQREYETQFAVEVERNARHMRHDGFHAFGHLGLVCFGGEPAEKPVQMQKTRIPEGFGMVQEDIELFAGAR